MTQIDMRDENGKTIADYEREIDELNEQAIALITTPPKTGEPVLVQLSTLTKVTAALVGNRDELKNRQKQLDEYAVQCATAAAARKQARQLDELIRRVQRLEPQLFNAKQKLSSYSSMNHRQRLLAAGIPSEIVSEIERQNSG